MTEPTNRQKNYAFTLLNLQVAYDRKFTGDASDTQLNAELEEIRDQYATALIGFLEDKD